MEQAVALYEALIRFEDVEQLVHDRTKEDIHFEFKAKNQSGWMVLLNFTIIALPFILIWLGCVRGTIGTNKYGADPLPQPALSVT